ncbi:MAG: electron transfer flavoprotein-ubiquinone oxidoreductase [Micavibrio aeruginosavorus]|uniref:Electron transfer flavoprotein-ubiquinone oxidoreductase n=1 Tax=Micavibrio aeruginosavorus TaxID=349221 RepID=A0A7T5R4X9_9BACT|nr:MAG: electron transfer flavoprotein-ubiquinone oxidoreductase [Micavibrio aeruginosavorus]
MEYDVVIVGGGPAGLSCAIRLKQVDPALNVCVLEKGSEVGAHLLSGAVFETRALDELIPDWKDSAGKEGGAPLTVRAQDDRFLFLTKTKSFRLPTPPQMHNHGNYIISLGLLGRWLAQRAEALGVEIYPGFAASEVLYDGQGAVIGVATGDMGVDREGQRTAQFQPGMELHARQTVFAEGCHGSLTKTLIAKLNLRENSCPQTYGLGVKELWEIPAEKHRQGLIIHTIGWPADAATYGGSWMYHLDNNMVSIGYVVGLDYQNPWLSPFEEMQRMKTHPAICQYLEGGRRVAYGARALVEGGFQSLPKLTFAGGVLIGDTAGFLNVPKIKGNHMAMKSGMVAAEAVAALLADSTSGYGAECVAYPEKLRQSWLWQELYQVRNIRPGFHFGLWLGLIHAAFQTWGGWRLPYTLKNHADHAQLKRAAAAAKIDYPKPDGVLTFDRLTSVRLSNTMHEEGQPVHLKLRDPAIPLAVNLPDYAEPAQRYCPAAVYEVVEQEGQKKFVINSQNCVHCKTCDIKDPSQNIDWTVPQGGGGPNYTNM